MAHITVIAKITARQDSIESVRNELLKLVAPTRDESGCIDYCLHQDAEDPALFIFYENWENRACLARHMESDHFKRYVSAVEGMLEGKTVNIMARIA